MNLDFSIIVPTYNRPEGLRACLRSLARLDYPRTDYEVVVVDDGGTESIDQIAATVQDGLQITVVQQPNAGPAAARNTGANIASSRYLAFTDDDCAPMSDWLTSMASALMEEPESLVGGRTVNLLADNPFAVASQQLISYHYGHFNGEPNRARFLCSNNWAMAADAFNDIGGFDTGFRMASGEDIEFCDRWLSSGRPLIYAPSAVIGHAHPLTLRSFWKQQFDYGRGAVQVQHRLGERHQSGRTKNLEFYAGMLALPLDEGTVARRLGGFALVGLAQIANAAGFRWERRRDTRVS